MSVFHNFDQWIDMKIISRLIDDENNLSEVVEISHSHSSLANELLQLVIKCLAEGHLHARSPTTHLFQIFPAACRRQTLNPSAKNPSSLTCSQLVVPGLLITLFVIRKPC